MKSGMVKSLKLSNPQRTFLLRKSVQRLSKAKASRVAILNCETKSILANNVEDEDIVYKLAGRNGGMSIF